MSLRTYFPLFSLVAILALPLAASAQQLTPEQVQRMLREQQRRGGQGPYGGQQQPNVPRENLSASGVIKGARGNVLQMQTAEGEAWLIQVQPNRPWDVTFTGPAEASFVKPGMLVQFSTKLNRRGQADEPVTQLTIFTMKEGYQLGVLSDVAIGGGGASSGLFEEPQEKPKEKPAKVKLDENTVYRVAGQITKISRTGEMTINAGGTSVKAELAEDAKVSVDVNDLAYARPGDKVEVRGWYIAGNKGQAVGNQIAVSAAEPLAGPKKKGPPGAKSTDDAAEKTDEKAAAEATKKLFE
jgi:hypothetical protein